MKKLNVDYIRDISRKFNYNEINSKAAEMSFYLLLFSLTQDMPCCLYQPWWNPPWSAVPPGI